MNISKTALLAILCLSFSIISVLGKPSMFDDEDENWTGSGSGDGEDDEDGRDRDLSSPEIEGRNIWDIVAGFNESCTIHRCNYDRSGLECSTSVGRCVCAPGNFYIPREEKCYRIPGPDERCEFKEQCHESIHGKHSNCDRITGRCYCYDNEQNGRRDTVEAGTCYIKRNYDEPCDNDPECESSIVGEAYCAPKDPNAPQNMVMATRVCQCKPGFVWNNAACLKIATRNLDSDCEEDIQCQASDLGQKSRCGHRTKKCECHDSENPGSENAVFFEPRGVCFSKLGWNFTCTDDDECRASIHSEAECLDDNSESYVDNRRTCQCPEGKICSSSSEVIPKEVEVSTEDGGGAFGLDPSTFNLVILTGVGFMGARVRGI